MNKLHNKVIWNEGLFVQPQHFQQQERYFESYVHAKSRTQPYAWGFDSLELDRGQLDLGKVAITRASGIFPDGTPFAIPETHPAPAPLSLPAPGHNLRVYLGVSWRRSHTKEVNFDPDSVSQARYRVVETQLCDVITNPKQQIDTQLGALNIRLLSDNDSVDDYAVLAVTHVDEIQSNGAVTLKGGFIPPTLDSAASPVLTTLCHEVEGLLQQQIHSLSGQLKAVIASHQETLAILRVAAMNRGLSTLQHLMTLRPLHPERLYGGWRAMWAELFSLKNVGQTLPTLTNYQHDHPESCFHALATALREVLKHLDAAEAQQIPLIEQQAARYHATVEDRRLYEGHDFILAIRSDLAETPLRDQVNRILVSSQEMIARVQELGTEAITLTALPTQPSGIPYRQDEAFAFFRLDKRAGASANLWPEPDTSAGFGLHVNQLHTFPNLHLELWAVKTPAAQR